MGLSLANIRSRYNSSLGKDPLFAAFDGATCPKNAPATNTYGAIIGGLLGQGSLTFSSVPSTGTVPLTSPYAALLNKGLIRIALPVAKGAEFTVEVIRDPYGCNLDSHYNQVTNSDGSISQIVSVYRRPLIAANLASKVKTLANSGVLPPENLLTRLPLGVDAQGNLENGNIMSDGREPTLSSQAIDAT